MSHIINHFEGMFPSSEAFELIDHSRGDKVGPQARDFQEESNARTLSKPFLVRFFSVAVDLLLAALPVLFIILACLSMSLNQRPTSEYGNNIQAITLLSPTIFPIVYAAIVGKVLKSFALYRAERGTKVGTLERLFGSQSLFAAFERQISLRNIDFLGFGIILLWLLSPIGGQSSLRLLTTIPRELRLNETIRHLPIQAYQHTSIYGASGTSSEWPTYAPLYMTSIRTAKNYMASSLDIWNNLKIPDISSISKNHTSNEDWIDIEPTDRHNVVYTSLLGIPVAGVPHDGNTTFDLQSRYWSVSCGDFAVNENNTRTWSTELGGSSNNQSTFGISGHRTTENSAQIPINFTYTSKRGEQVSNYTPQNITSIDCLSQPMYVESRVICVGQDCQVVAMRNMSKRPPLFPTTDEKVWDEVEVSFFNMLLFALPGADLGKNQGTVRQSEMVELWMEDPETTFAVDAWYFVDLSTIPPAVFSGRLQMAINTFWDSTFASKFRMGNLSLDQDLTLPDLVDSGGNFTLYFNSTQLSGTRFDGEQYICRRRYAILTIAISILLFLMAVASIILRSLTLAPDILGYISTYTRNNPYTRVDQPSHFDGIETARALRNVHVMIGDVKSEEEVGHVAFATMDERPARLRKGRLYD